MHILCGYGCTVSVFLLSMHHLYDVLGAYFLCLLMSLKMQIKGCQVLAAKELSRWTSRQGRSCKSDLLQRLLGVFVAAQLITHTALANGP